MKPLSLLIYHVFQVVMYWSFISFATEAAHFHSRQLNDTDTGEEFDKTTIFSSVATIVATMIGALIAAITSCTIFLCKRKHKMTSIQSNGAAYTALKNEQQPEISPTDIQELIDEYAMQLKDKYEQNISNDTEKIGYIELEVKSGDSHLRNCETLETLRSVLDKIMAPSDNGKRVRCILIEGESGVGKSTLVSQICLKWAREELMQYKLVVLVELRIVQATCVGDIFQQYATHSMNNPSNMESFLKAIGDGSGTLIILDGYDELPLTNQQTRSFYTNLIQGTRLLSKATIIITSRPTVKLSVGRRLKISGFTEQQIIQYVELKFSSEKRAAFMQYISNHIMIKNMICIPLYIHILAIIFDSDDEDSKPQLKTFFQLFDTFTRCLIARHLKHNQRVDDNFAIRPTLQQNLPALIAEQFQQIVQMAYNSLKQNFIAGIDNFDHLSVMKKTETKNDGPKFSFLHQTHQEYLAALHIVYTPDLPVPDSFGTRDILRFLAGMCYDNDTVMKKVECLLQKAGDQCSLQMVRCVYECEQIVDRVPIIRKILNDGPVSVCGKIPFDYYLIGYCICRVGGEWNVTIRSKDEIDLLRDGLLNLGSKKIEKKILNLELRIQFGPLLANIEQILNSILEITTCNIHSLNLDFIAFRICDAKLLKKLIRQKGLKKIEIRNSCKNVDVLLSALFKPSSLDTVHFSGTLSPGCGTESMECKITKLFSKNKNLKRLYINDIIIDPKTLGKILSHGGSLNGLEELVFCVTRRFRNLTSSFCGELEPHSYQEAYIPDESTKCESAQDVPLNFQELIEAAQVKGIKLHFDTGSNTLRQVPIAKSCDRRSQTIHACSVLSVKD